MAISPDRLERYKDFVDPEHTEDPYDPRKGIDKLMGVLSTDPKGIVLAAMGEDWYGSNSRIQSRIFFWLKELGLPRNIWPINKRATWSYFERRDKSKQLINGSLIDLGAVVKKAEDPYQLLYHRTLAGAELAVPVIQKAVAFVPRALAYAERQRLAGQKDPKFVSMQKIIGGVNSRTDQRKPLAVYDTIDFLVHNPGKHGMEDIHDKTKISLGRLTDILSSLGNCGIIDHIAPTTDKEGQRGRGWSVYTVVDPQSIANLDPVTIYQDIKDFNIKNRKRRFSQRTDFTKMIDHIKKYPNDEYEYNALAQELGIWPQVSSVILSLLEYVNILQRPDPGFKGAKVIAFASAHDLTYMFHDLVCDPIEYVANTLSPLPLKAWNKEEVAIYLQNYDDKRCNTGLQGGEYARGLLTKILSEAGEDMKESYIVDKYNLTAEAELTAGAVSYHIQILIGLGILEQSKQGYYRFVEKQG